MVLALDWDDTVTSYTEGLSVLANTASTIHIITLNNKVTVQLAQQVLNYCAPILVHIMPDSEFDTSLEDV